MAEIDETFFDILRKKEFSGYNIYLAKRDSLYFVVVTDRQKPILTYSSFGSELARKVYKEWKNNIATKDTQWLGDIT